MILNGDIHLVRRLQAEGVKPRWATKWLGRWTIIRDGKCPDLAAFLEECRVAGVGAHLQFFYAGDRIGAAFFRGVATSDGKTLAAWWQLIRAVAATVRASSVPVLVNLETEWNKGGIWEDPSGWDREASAAAAELKAASPTVRIVCAAGAWHDPKLLVPKIPKLAAVVDIWGTQNLRGLTRQDRAGYLAGPDHLLKVLQGYRSMVGSKPLMATDVAYSSYGGPFAKDHPFEGGRGDAEEALQAQAFKRLVELRPAFEAAGVTDFFLRGLKDQPWNPPTEKSTQFAKDNHYGFGELNWGLLRQDGTAKPVLAVALQLAQTPMVPKAQLDAAIAERDAARAQVVDLQARLDRVRAALG